MCVGGWSLCSFGWLLWVGMVCVVVCVLSIVDCCLLFVCYSLLLFVCYLFFFVCCSLFLGGCLSLCVVCCLLFVVRRSFGVVCSVSVLAWYVLFVRCHV